MKKNQAVMVLSVLAVLLVLTLAAGAVEDPAKVAGKWEMKMQTPRGERTITLNFEQDGADLKGTLTGGFGGGGRRGGRQGGARRGGGGGGETSLTGTVDGNKITFTVKRQTPRGEREIEYKGTVEGDTIKGTIQFGPREIEWTAKRMK